MGWHCITVWECQLKPKAREQTLESLAYTLNPALPVLTGNLEGAMGFLEKRGISYGIKFDELSDEELRVRQN